MGTGRAEGRDEFMRDALRLMEAALELLDGAAAPAHIGAHLDLAIVELRKSLDDQGCAGLSELKPPVQR